MLGIAQGFSNRLSPLDPTLVYIYLVLELANPTTDIRFSLVTRSPYQLISTAFLELAAAQLCVCFVKFY